MSFREKRVTLGLVYAAWALFGLLVLGLVPLSLDPHVATAVWTALGPGLVLLGFAVMSRFRFDLQPWASTAAVVGTLVGGLVFRWGAGTLWSPFVIYSAHPVSALTSFLVVSAFEDHDTRVSPRTYGLALLVGATALILATLFERVGPAAKFGGSMLPLVLASLYGGIVAAWSIRFALGRRERNTSGAGP